MATAPLRYRGPFPFAIGRVEKADGTLVKLDAHGRPSQVGVLEDMPGPGRHFYNPLEFERELVPDVIVKPGQVGLVTSKMGKDRTGGSFLVDNDGERGVWRKVLTPGRYRLNNYAYEVKLVDADACLGARAKGSKNKDDHALIPPGYVGVVTNKTDNATTGETQGIQDNVLQPGIYFLNPEEKQVDIISIGFNETTQMVKTREGTTNLNNRLGKTLGKDPTTCLTPASNSRPTTDSLSTWTTRRSGTSSTRPRRRPPVRRSKDVEQGDPAANRLDLPALRLQKRCRSISWSATSARSSRPTRRRSLAACSRRRT